MFRSEGISFRASGLMVMFYVMIKPIFPLQVMTMGARLRSMGMGATEEEYAFIFVGSWRTELADAPVYFYGIIDVAVAVSSDGKER
mmetsp:Transcript_26876/g.57862  ORF Transcript_26876/g.57862 Transcript_26876/m.57862 type:complete len:86 (-) Transcript_26876:8-265(-)